MCTLQIRTSYKTPPRLMFLCESYRRALALWHRLASGLVRPRIDANRFRSPSDRRAGRPSSSYWSITPAYALESS
jgi:hypothetical protein